MKEVTSIVLNIYLVFKCRVSQKIIYKLLKEVDNTGESHIHLWNYINLAINTQCHTWSSNKILFSTISLIKILLRNFLQFYWDSCEAWRCHEKIFGAYTLKKCSLLKIENNSSRINFTHFREKTHLLAHELIFVSSSWRVYTHIKFHI